MGSTPIHRSTWNIREIVRCEGISLFLEIATNCDINRHFSTKKRTHIGHMAKVSIYRHKRDGMLHLRFTNMRTHASRALNIKVYDDQWDGKKIVNHPNAAEMNLSLTAILTSAQLELLKVVNSQPTKFAHPSILRDKVCDVIFPSGVTVTPPRPYRDGCQASDTRLYTPGAEEGG